MKLATFNHNGRQYVGIIDEKVHVLDVADMCALIDRGVDDISSIVTHSLERAEIELLAPIVHPRQDIICLGMNYLDHEKEAADFGGKAFEKKNDNVYFSKRVNRACATGETIPSHNDVTRCLDYETELAVILGEDLYKARKEDCYRAIFGYTILNDITARDIQSRHMQFYAGKSLEDSCPIGPWIVTADEFDQEPDLALRTFVNGQRRQDSRTSLLISGIGDILEELSGYMMLKKGTIIATGTPAGVGMGFTPPKYLKPGDEIISEIEGIGELVVRIGK